MAAVVFLLLCAAVHVKVQPYAYPVQNTLETWLFVSDVMFVSLGIGYAFVDPQSPHRHAVERLLKAGRGKIKLRPRNWRPVLLSCMIMACGRHRRTHCGASVPATHGQRGQRGQRCAPGAS